MALIMDFSLQNRTCQARSGKQIQCCKDRVAILPIFKHSSRAIGRMAINATSPDKIGQLDSNNKNLNNNINEKERVIGQAALDYELRMCVFRAKHRSSESLLQQGACASGGLVTPTTYHRLALEDGLSEQDWDTITMVPPLVIALERSLLDTAKDVRDTLMLLTRDATTVAQVREMRQELGRRWSDDPATRRAWRIFQTLVAYGADLLDIPEELLGQAAVCACCRGDVEVLRSVMGAIQKKGGGGGGCEGGGGWIKAGLFGAVIGGQYRVVEELVHCKWLERHLDFVVGLGVALDDVRLVETVYEQVGEVGVGELVMGEPVVVGGEVVGESVGDLAEAWGAVEVLGLIQAVASGMWVGKAKARASVGESCAKVTQV